MSEKIQQASQSRARAVEEANMVPGWMNYKALTWLSETASSLSPGARWLELGTFCGRSALCVGLSLPPGSCLWICDSFDPRIKWHSQGKKWHDIVQHQDWVITNETPLERFMRTLSYLRSERPDISVRFVNQPTSLISRTVPGKTLDVAFVDADHTLQSVISDCAVCEGLLKPEGLLCGHDYGCPRWPDVERTVNALYTTRVRVVAETTLWYLAPA